MHRIVGNSVRCACGVAEAVVDRESESALGICRDGADRHLPPGLDPVGQPHGSAKCWSSVRKDHSPRELAAPPRTRQTERVEALMGSFADRNDRRVARRARARVKGAWVHGVSFNRPAQATPTTYRPGGTSLNSKYPPESVRAVKVGTKPIDWACSSDRTSSSTPAAAWPSAANTTPLMRPS
jgi:hypothetical protein